VTLLPSTMVHQRDLKRQLGCTIAIPLLRVTMSMVLEVDSPFQNCLLSIGPSSCVQTWIAATE
jgi:hypothetical protein